jgi:hypothetical protein
MVFLDKQSTNLPEAGLPPRWRVMFPKIRRKPALFTWRAQRLEALDVLWAGGRGGNDLHAVGPSKRAIVREFLRLAARALLMTQRCFGKRAAGERP